MKLIQRDYYLKKMIDVIATPDIKVITGVRRCGKSKLLDAFIDYLSKTDDNNIRERNFDPLYQIWGLLQNLSWND